MLDTQALLWWLHEPKRLSRKASRAILEAESDEIRVSAISFWEIAVKTELGKLRLPLEIGEWYRQACCYPGLMIEPMSAVDAIASTQLPGAFHKDPADRIIVATARRHGCPLVTADRKILDYPHVETVW